MSEHSRNEGFTELSKSTISRPIARPSQQSEIRTEGRTIDRHGVASRFLRLAHRINMEQLKLAALIVREGEALAEPLTDEELAEEARQAALDAAEIAAARQRAEDTVGNALCGVPSDDRETTDSLPRSSLVTPDREGPPSPSADDAPTWNLEPETLNSALHNLHNESPPEIAATPPAACICMLQPGGGKNSPCTCIIHCDEPSWPRENEDSPAVQSLAST